MKERKKSGRSVFKMWSKFWKEGLRISIADTLPLDMRGGRGLEKKEAPLKVGRKRGRIKERKT